MKPAERTALVLITVGVGLLLRTAFAATAQVVEPLRADAGQYARCAQNLLEHGVYGCDAGVPPQPDSFRSPGYPLLIAACRLVAGANGWQALLAWVQVVLGAAVVPLTFWFSRRFLPFGFALAAAAVTALSPHLVVGSVYVLTETLTAFLLALAFALLGCALAASDARRGTAAGTAFGLLALVNEAMAPLLPLAALALGRAQGRRAALVLAAAGLLVLAPWQVRNAITPLQRTGGERLVASLSHGSYPGMVFGGPESFGFPYRYDPEQPAFGQSWAGFWPVFAARVREQPLRHATWYLLEKPWWLWSWSILQGHECYVYEVRNGFYGRQPVAAASLAVMRWLHWPLQVLALAGAACAWRRRRTQPLPWVAASSLLWTTALYAAFLPDPRYLVPFKPVAAALAMVGVAWASQRWCARARMPEPVPSLPAVR